MGYSLPGEEKLARSPRSSRRHRGFLAIDHRLNPVFKLCRTKLKKEGVAGVTGVQELQNRMTLLVRGWFLVLSQALYLSIPP